MKATLMKLLTSDTSSAAIEAELEKVRQKLADRRADLATAEADHDAAIQERLAHLLGDPEPAQLKKLEAQVLAAVSRRDGYAHAISALQTSVSELERRLAEAREDEQRHRDAAALDRQTDAMEDFAKDVAPVVRKLGQIVQKHTLDPKVFGLALRTGAPVTGDTLKALIVAEALCSYETSPLMAEIPVGVDTVGVGLLVTWLDGNKLTRGRPREGSAFQSGKVERGSFADLVAMQRARAQSIREGRDATVETPSATVVALPKVEKGAA